MAIPCVICGPGRVEVIAWKDRSRRPLRSVICVQCGLVWSDPRPPVDLEQYYRDEYRLDYKGVSSPSLRHVYRAGRLAVARIRLIRQYAPANGKLLDVGAGGGEFVWASRRAGWEAFGVEPNTGYRRYARDEYDIPVHEGFVETVTWPESNFDVITMWHALEHCGDPVAVLGQVRRWLKDSGHVFVEVPNALARCHFPASRFHRAHLYTFSPVTLEAAAAKAGMRAVTLKTSSDEGNILAVLSRGEAQVRLDGNCERVKEAVGRHTILSHMLTPHPYRRPLERIARSLGERWAVRKARGGRDVLEPLWQQAVRDESAVAAGSPR